MEEYIKSRFLLKYTEEDYKKAKEKYCKLKKFKANENVFDKNPDFDDITHYYTRLKTQYYIEKAFNSMLIEKDENIAEDLEVGNIGTPGRIAKVWCGYDTHDDRELGSGRFSVPVRLAKFPNTQKTNIPITKKIDLISNCSHHFITFSSIRKPDSYAVISYIPDKFVLGISKLQRLTNYIAQRFWLQEDLTKALYDEISKAAETEDVFVGLYEIIHGCETDRGAMGKDGGFTSEYYGGAFLDANLREQVKK